MNAIKQVHTHHVQHHVHRAIGQRLGRPSPSAVIAVTRDTGRPEGVIVHVNSGGNACAAEQALRARGYRVEPMDYDPFAPGHYGVQFRVVAKPKASSREGPWCPGRQNIPGLQGISTPLTERDSS